MRCVKKRGWRYGWDVADGGEDGSKNADRNVPKEPGRNAGQEMEKVGNSSDMHQHCRAEAFFASTEAKALKPRFYMHPPTTRPPSHYAHLADALRYVYADDHEWTMIVEDDFVLCGSWGMEGILRVLNELGSTLVARSDRRPLSGRIVDDAWGEEGTNPARWRGAFVGTGGRYEMTSRRSISYVDDSVNRKRPHPPPHPPSHPYTSSRIPTDSVGDRCTISTNATGRPRPTMPQW